MHFYELENLSVRRDGEDALHIEKKVVDLARNWLPTNTTRKTGRQKRHQFFDVPFEKQSKDAHPFEFVTETINLGLTDIQIIRNPKKVEIFTFPVCRCGRCQPWHFRIAEQSNRRFKGAASKKPFDGITSHLKNAPATWEYVPEDERIGRRHGLTKWIDRQDKPVTGQEETISFGKEYKNLHAEEAQQVQRSRQLKSKRNTGGAQPESAREDNDFLQWMVDTGAAQEKTKKELEKEFADQLRQQEWKGSSPEMSGRAGRPTLIFGENESPTSMVWDGDSFVLEDQPEYFEGRVVEPTVPLTAEERAAHFADHKNLVEAGAVDLREDEIILEIKLEHITREEGAKELEISVAALDKRIQRRDLEARMLRDGKFQIPYLALTYEQAADIADNNAVYVQVDLNGWRWCKLPIEQQQGTADQATVDQAIDALKREKVLEALRQHKESKAARKAAGKHGTNERYPRWTVALKEVKDRYDKQVFHPDRIRIVQRPPRAKQAWEGLTERRMRPFGRFVRSSNICEREGRSLRDQGVAVWQVCPLLQHM